MSNNAKAISETILQQLGGNRFIAMTGANSFSYGLFASDNPGLSFRIRGSKNWTGVIISLASDDTYTVKFVKMTGSFKTGLKMKEKVLEGIYAESLQEVFTENTGLYTKL